MSTNLTTNPRLHERAAVVLAADVVSERVAPGDSFASAEEIVERFGVSRTVARETIQTLSMLGLIRVQHGKRNEVLPPEEWNVLTPVLQEALQREQRLEPILRDLYEFRLLIEPQAAAWMAERGRESDLADLAVIAAEMGVLAEDVKNSPRVMAADQDFHRLIARASSNRVLATVARNFWEAVSLLWLESKLTAQELQVVAAQHQEIAQAIAARDSARAAESMRAHLLAASVMDVGHFPADGDARTSA